MKELIFRCELLSDIVLNSSGASEGRLPSHEFIPGSNFMGIVARKYQAAGNMAYELFHSGNISFGDAHIVLADKRSHKVPAVWFFLKGTKLVDGVWVHHKITDGIRQEHRDAGIQLKQARSGFFVKSGDGIQLADMAGMKQYAMKSSYDRDKRKAADSQLYGYTSLQQGSLWEFSVCLCDVESEEDDLLKFIKENLEGERNVGRSRSAQYGRVKITLQNESEVTDAEENYTKGDEIVLYAESRLSFLDKFGQPTLQPAVQDFGLPKSSEILWDKSQVLTSRFAPWNGKRRTRDADRVCIDKGSVFVVKLKEGVSLLPSLAEVGIYKSEGFGRVLVNPDFLSVTVEKGKMDQTIIDTPISCSEEVSGEDKTVAENSSPQLKCLLKRRKRADEKDREVLEQVNLFKKDFGSLFPAKFASQWGGVRARAAKSTSAEDLMANLFAEKTASQKGGYLMHGVAAEKWQKKGRCHKFKKFLDEQRGEIVLPLVNKLAAEMAKISSSNKQEGE